MPASSIATIRSVVATGRRMKSRDGFIANLRRRALARRPIAARSARWALLRGRDRLALAGDDFDLGAFAQLVGAVDHDLHARLQAAGHDRNLTLRRAELHGAYRDRLVVLHDIDERARRAALDG